MDRLLGGVILHIVKPFYASKIVSDSFLGFLTKNYTSLWALVDPPFSIIRFNAQGV